MNVWLVYYNEYPDDPDSREEVINVCDTFETVQRLYPDVKWIDAHTVYKIIDEDQIAYMGFDKDQTVLTITYARYWASRWEVQQ